MNGFDRYMGVLHGEPVDCLPRMPILMAFAADFIGKGYDAFASDYRILVEANLKCAEHFGIDVLDVMSDPYRETQGFGAEIEYVPDGVPRCLKPPLEDNRDLTLLKRPDPNIATRMRNCLNAIETYRNTVNRQYAILGWVEGPAAEAADLRGVSNFLIDLADDPAFAGDLMSLCVDVAIDFAIEQIEVGADTIGVGDAICSQVSTSMYRDLIFPHEVRLVRAIHNAGGYIRLHICGDTTHLLPVIRDLGADIIDLDWQVDIARARQTLKPGQVIAGNLDPVNAVMKGTPDSIRQGMRHIYDQVGNPFMVTAGCEIPIGTPPENLLALCQPISWQ